PHRLVGYLRAEGLAVEHPYDVHPRSHPDSDVFAYARAHNAALMTQDHDLERDSGQYPPPHAGLVIVELPRDWPREHKMGRILATLRSLASQPLGNTLVII